MNKILIFVGMFVLSFLIAFGINQAISGLNSVITGYSIFQSEDEEKIQKNNEVLSESCFDSDGGLNYEIEGFVEYCDTNNNCRNEEDSCSNGKLSEWYCENNKLSLQTFKCQVGYFCYKGICRLGSESSSGSSPATSDSVTVSEIYNVFELGDLSFSRLDLAKNEKANFKILGLGYSVTLNNLEIIQATIDVSGQSSTFDIGQEKQFDLNGDGINELSVKFDSTNIITNNAKISLTKL